MGVDTKARLYGNINEAEIIRFLKERYNCTVTHDIKTEMYEDAPYIKEYYDEEKRHFTRSGFINIRFDEENGRSLFYCKHSVNYHENLDYYREIGLEEMVKAETTYISLHSDKQGIEIVGAIAEHFGGWFWENDCNDDSCQEFVGNNKDRYNRIDIMVDLETLGTGDNPPVFQVSAAAFNIKSGHILDTFDELADISTYKNIEGGTLKWWLNTNKELLTNLVNSGNFTEQEIVTHFCEWIEDIKCRFGIDKHNLHLWGNGILFDNRIIQKKCNEYGIQYPIYYTADRDMRTIVDLAAIKGGFANVMDYRASIPNVGTAHNAMDDVYHQVAVVSKAYQELTKQI